MKSLTELLEQFAVRMDYSCVDSNLVYPMDMGTKYEFKGYAQEVDVLYFLKRVHLILNSKGESHRIANKYAIPFMQTGYLHKIETYFYYQHDDKIWIISLKEDSKKYLG